MRQSFLPIPRFAVAVSYLVIATSLAKGQPPVRPGWDVAWYDDFSGNSLDTSNWNAIFSTSPTNNSLHAYLPEQVTVSGGNLVITSTDTPFGGLNYRSGEVKSTRAYQYGRYEVRDKLPTTRGMWPAIWLLPDTGAFPWPSQGEIDIMENRGDQPTLTSSAFHWGTNPPYFHTYIAREQQAWHGGMQNYHDSFHTYAVEWEPNQIRFYVDEVHHATVRDADTNGFLSNQTAPMKLIINTAIGGDFLDNPDGSTIFPQEFQIDHVYVYRQMVSGPADLTFENGSFEANSGTLASWSTIGNTIPNVQTETEAVKEGSYSLKLFGQFNNQENYAGVEQGITVNAGDEIMAQSSSYIRSADSLSGTSNRAVMKIDFYSQRHGAFGSADYIGSDEIQIGDASTANDVWHDFELLSTVPSGAVEARLALVFVQPGNEGGAIHIDDVRFGVVEEPVVITPTSFEVTRGTHVAGGIAELSNSDDEDLQLVRAADDIQSRADFEIEAASPIAQPSLLEVQLESSVFARTTIDQTIELFNFNTAMWEELDFRPASRFVDATVNVAASGDLSRFVEPGTQSIRARVRFQSVVARQQFAANTDAWSWTIQ